MVAAKKKQAAKRSPRRPRNRRISSSGTVEPNGDAEPDVGPSRPNRGCPGRRHRRERFPEFAEGDSASGERSSSTNIAAEMVPSSPSRSAGKSGFGSGSWRSRRSGAAPPRVRDAGRSRPPGRLVLHKPTVRAAVPDLEKRSPRSAIGARVVAYKRGSRIGSPDATLRFGRAPPTELQAVRSRSGSSSRTWTRRCADRAEKSFVAQKALEATDCFVRSRGEGD